MPHRLLILLIGLCVIASQSNLRVRSAPSQGECCTEACCCQEVESLACCSAESDAVVRLVDACGCGGSHRDGVVHVAAPQLFLAAVRIEFGRPPPARTVRRRDPRLPRAMGSCPEPPVPRA